MDYGIICDLFCVCSILNFITITLFTLASEGAVKSQKEAPAKKAEAAKQAAEPQEEGKKGKDKDAKKEARKAAKADAKNKVVLMCRFSLVFFFFLLNTKNIGLLYNDWNSFCFVFTLPLIKFCMFTFISLLI